MRTLNKVYLFFLLISFALIANAQKKEAQWIDLSWRKANYSDNVYITGFAQNKLDKKESLLKATESLVKQAKSNLIESVVTQIESSSSLQSNSQLDGKSKNFSQNFVNEVKSSSDARLVGIKTETYYDKRKKMLYAFAFTRRDFVVDYYDRHINKNITLIEGYLTQGKSLAEKLKKRQARKMYENSLPLFDTIEYAQQLIQAIQTSSLLMEDKEQQVLNLHKKYSVAIAELNKRSSIYIQCESEIFGKKTNLLAPKLKAVMSDSSFHFVNDIANVDWILKIHATTREHTESMGIYFSYVDAEVSFENAKTKQVIYEDALSAKGGHMKDYNEAAKKAYNEMVKKLSHNIFKCIND